MAIHTLRYLYRTRHHGITYYQGKQGEEELTAYVDASWADTPGNIQIDPDPNGRRSSSGHIIYLAGGPISWESRTQSITTLSSTEAELVATVTATRDVLHLRRVISSIGQHQGTTKVYGDSEPCLKLLEDTHSQTSKRSRHIEVRWFYAREHQAAGNIRMVKVNTHDNVADITTKNLGRTAHHFHATKLVRPHMERKLKTNGETKQWEINAPHTLI